MTICTANCEKECKYAVIYEQDKANVFVRCEAYGKSFRYGVMKECELKEKK